MLSVNSSVHLSEHYAAVQASLTPQQQQDFTQNLRSTFGQEGKVSNGAAPIVALSLAILFDTVASRVKGKYVSDHEPIPGLFLRDPTGTYSAPVYTVSKYLRLVPHIANNPTRMKEETEKYLLKLKHTLARVSDQFNAAERFEDITVMNSLLSYWMGQYMEHHLKQITNLSVGLINFTPREIKNELHKILFTLNCDPKTASEIFRAIVEYLDNHNRRVFTDCIESNEGDESFIETIAGFNLLDNLALMTLPIDESVTAGTDFDLKA